MDVAVAGLDNDFEERVADALLPGTRIVPCSVSSLEGDTPGEFAAIILGPDIPLLAAIERARAVDTEHPETPVVLVAPHDPEILREAILAGARDVWHPGLDQDELAASLAQVLETSRHRSRFVQRRHDEHPLPTNELVVVLAAKGGVGQTVLATNLGTAVARRQDRSVALIDLDLQFGDVAAALQLLPDHDIADAMAVIDNLPALKTMLADHPSGLHVLRAPADVAAADAVDPEVAARLVDVVSAQFDLTIVDVGDGLTEHAVSTLELATSILVVTTPDLFVIKDTQRLLRVLDQILTETPSRRLVLNHSTDRSGLSHKEIEELLAWPIDVEIPTHSSIPLASPRGEAVMSAGRPTRRALQRLVNLYTADNER